jgi:hypothetical protein
MPNERDTANDKSSISQAQSYKAIGEFWDSHSLADYWDQTEEADFIVNLDSTEVYYRLELNLSNKVRDIAQRRGISPETLLNLWIQEKLQQEPV